MRATQALYFNYVDEENEGNEIEGERPTYGNSDDSVSTYRS